MNELQNYYGVSGREDSICSFLYERLSPLSDDTVKDSMGNLHFYKKGTGKSAKKAAVIAYMDEPGIIVTRITEDGYLKFETIGHLTPAGLISKKVILNGIRGIISLKAVHLTSKQERSIPVKLSQLFIDIGASSRKEAEDFVQIGDHGALEEDGRTFGDGYIKGHALGSRVGCVIAENVLRQRYPFNLHVIITVQREVGCRGIQTASWKLSADRVIILDAETAQSYDKVSEKFPELGKGAVILTASGSGLVNPRLIQPVINKAEERQLKYQLFASKDKGQEEVLYQRGYGDKTLTFCIPVRYKDTACQVAHMDDIDSMKNLTQIALMQVVSEEVANDTDK